MLSGMNAILEILQSVALLALHLLDHDGLASVDLDGDIMDHDAGMAVLKLTSLEVPVCSFNATSPSVFRIRQKEGKEKKGRERKGPTHLHRHIFLEE